MEEKFRLSWKTYADHTKTMFGNIYESSELTDITLVCDDKKRLRAHKIILSSCSPAFREIILSEPTNSMIYLRGIQSEEMESVLQFMYLGEATFYQERMNDFLNVAKALEIKELSSINIQNQNKIIPKQQEIDQIQHNDADNFIALDDNNDLLNPVTEKSTALVDQSIKTEHKYNPQKSACHLCGKEYASPAIVKNHIESAHNGNTFDCEECDKKYSDITNLRRHRRAAHAGVKEGCGLCGKIFNDRSNMMRHMKLHTITEDQKPSCPICHKVISDKTNLKKHLVNVHGKSKIEAEDNL